jgi:8-oxo-dGTP pyrophosphatase MutT (NUDIX family)
MNKNNLLTLLQNYEPFFEKEKIFKKEMIHFIENNKDFCTKNNTKGHITGSAWVIDNTQKNALLIHHKKLNKWLQMGGHIENQDITIFDTALREAKEESGITNFIIKEEIFDIDIHTIPQKNEVPEHLHYDIRILLICNETNFEHLQKEEINAIQWFSIEDLLQSENESIQRMAQKIDNV